MFCPNCGANIPEGSKFCSNCGYAVEGEAPSGTYGAPVPPDSTYDSSYDSTYGTSYGPTYGSTVGEPMSTDRDLAMYILLSIVTCGIYSYYYIYQLAKDVNTICYEDGEETPGLAAFILLSLVTCGIYGYYWTYKIAARIKANGPRLGVQIQEGGSDVLLWMVLGYFTCSITYYIGMNIIIKNMNALCRAYNRVNGLA